MKNIRAFVMGFLFAVLVIAFSIGAVAVSMGEISIDFPEFSVTGKISFKSPNVEVDGKTILLGMGVMLLLVWFILTALVEGQHIFRLERLAKLLALALIGTERTTPFL